MEVIELFLGWKRCDAATLISPAPGQTEEGSTKNGKQITLSQPLTSTENSPLRRCMTVLCMGGIWGVRASIHCFPI